MLRRVTGLIARRVTGSSIAQMGGGEAFLTSDEEQIVTQLMILVFGSEFRDKVLEAFDLMR